MRVRLLRLSIFLLALRLLWMYLIPAWSHIETDFPNYYTAAWSVAHDRPLADLYDPEWFQRETERAGITGQTALFNYFTPFSALVMLPVARLSPLTAKRVWVVVNLAAFALLVILVARVLQAPKENVLLIALLGGDALGNNFTFGQFYLVLTLLLVLAVTLLARHPGISGVCLALASITKVFPALLVGYIALLRNWKVVASTLLAVSVLSLAGVGAMGWTPHRVYVEEVLGRSLRGEIQDPYSVQWNTLQALLRRALVPEAGLNPEPIADAPALFFFLRPFLTVVILAATFIALQNRKLTFFELGALMAAVSLTTPSQASYHQVLFIPAVAAAIHREVDGRVQLLWATALALICSNYMGAFTGFNSGPAMVLAFPRVYLVFGLWVAFLGRRAVASMNLRTVMISASLIALVSAIPEYRRWKADDDDGARMVTAAEAGLMETHPSVGSGGLVYSSLGREGYARFHASAYGDGFVSESVGGVSGRLPGGTEIQGSNLSEPALGAESVVAIRDESAVFERTRDSDWKELFRGNSIVHDPAISPDGNSIAFSEFADGRYSIMEWNRSTGNIRVLAGGGADFRYPSYDPSGEWLAFSTNESGDWNIGRVSLKEMRTEILTTSSANDLMPAFAPDGRSMYFASDRRRGYRFTAIYTIALSR